VVIELSMLVSRRHGALCASAVLFICTALMGNAALADGDAPTTRALRLPAVNQIVIKQQGSANKKSDDEPKGCAHFRLTSSDVSSFLRNTGEIEKQDYLHAIDWSPCAVSGSIKLADGRTGDWSIHKLRGGTLTLSDGSEYFLYCAKCKSRKFAK
jgi:hypothetical protein